MPAWRICDPVHTQVIWSECAQHRSRNHLSPSQWPGCVPQPRSLDSALAKPSSFAKAMADKSVDKSARDDSRTACCLRGTRLLSRAVAGAYCNFV